MSAFAPNFPADDDAAAQQPGSHETGKDCDTAYT